MIVCVKFLCQLYLTDMTWSNLYCPPLRIVIWTSGYLSAWLTVAIATAQAVAILSVAFLIFQMFSLPAGIMQSRARNSDSFGKASLTASDWKRHRDKESECQEYIYWASSPCLGSAGPVRCAGLERAPFCENWQKSLTVFVHLFT